jgi:hypothetical protein
MLSAKISQIDDNVLTRLGFISKGVPWARIDGRIMVWRNKD